MRRGGLPGSLPRTDVDWDRRTLARDDDVLVVDKPPGLATTGRDRSDPHCLEHALRRHLGRDKVWAVHQLDRDTSGLVILALKKPVVEQWSTHLREGTKTYLALVHGAFEAQDLLLDARLGRTRDRKAQPRVDPHGQEARTIVTALEVGPSHTLLSARIETGRTHQVRLHLAHAGHPLVGERMHRAPPDLSAPRHMLHAWRIEVGGRSFEAPLPEDFVRACHERGLRGRTPP